MSAAVAQVITKAPSPPFRWAGGKRWLAGRLVAEIEATKPKLYIEPFLGAGAIALALSPKISKILADANPQLIDCWRCIQRAPEALVTELRSVESQFGDELEGYLAARDEFNFMVRNPRPMWIRRSAVFLYLNARCFNGLWRTNAKGLYNVPFGKLANPKRAALEDVQEISTAIRGADFRHEHYMKLMSTLYEQFVRSSRPRSAALGVTNKHALKGLAVYADSPYVGTFDGYAKDGFTDEDHQALAQILYAWADRGASIWASNSDTPLVREMYSWAQLEEVDEHHQVGSTGDRRGKRGCLLIRGGGACGKA